MASIQVTTAGYEVELDIPDDDQVTDAHRYHIMLDITRDRFQDLADDPYPVSDTTRADQLTALAALQAAITATMAAALPQVTITPE